MKIFKLMLIVALLSCLANNASAQTKITIALQSGSNDTICNNSVSVSFTSTVTGCSNPTYQWYINNSPISGQNGQSLSYNNFSNGDVVTCRQTNGTAPCTLDTSNAIKIIVKPNQSITLASAAGTNNQTICQYNAITPIKYNVTGATGTNITGLPTGVSGVYSNGVVTISGAPSVNGTFNYQVTTTGNNLCGSTAQVNGTITIKKDADPALIPGNVNTQQVVFNGQNYFIRCGNSSNANIQIANATTNTGNISQYKINWGDGSNDTTFNIFPAILIHNYVNGFYTLTLTTTSVDNCTSGISYGIFVGNSPQGTLGNPGNLSGCSPVSITFPITNTNVNVPGTTYEIDFGDGTILHYTHPNIPPSITHIYTESSCGKTASTGQSNSYSASMKVVNPCDEALSTISPIKISTSGTPKVSVPRNIFCVNESVPIIDSSKKGGFINGQNCQSGSSAYWSITPGVQGVDWTTTSNLGSNGGFPNDADNWATGDNLLNVIFNTPGNYTVTLHSANGCNSSNPQTADTVICITPIPIASFTTLKDTLCAGEDLTFTNASNMPSCGNNVYSWSTLDSNISGCDLSEPPTFVNSTTSTSANPVLNFAKPGKYIVSLITSIGGTTCSSTPFNKIIIVKDKPKAALSISKTSLCQGDVLLPTVTASCFATNATYNWSFTNATPASSNTQNPGTITFNGNGSGTISVKVSNVCGDTTPVQSVSINPKPVVTDTMVVQLSQCGATDGSITLKGLVSGTSYKITYDKNNVPQTPINKVADVNGYLIINNLSAGVYSNIVINLLGCLSDTLNPLTIADPIKPETPMLTGNTPICSGGTLNLGFSNTYAGTVNYNWTGPNGFTNTTSATPSISNITIAGDGTYSLTVTINNCTSLPGTKAIAVNQTPSAPSTSPLVYCQNAIGIPLTPNGNNFIWYNNATLTNGSTTAPTPSTTTAGTTTYYVIDSNITTGCKSGSSSLVVTVNTTPVISSLTSNNPAQCASNTGSISFNVVPVTGSYTVNYTKGGINQAALTNVSPSGGVITIPNLGAGLYDNIKVTLNNCPSNTLGSVTLSDPTKPATPILSGNTPICSGGTLNLGFSNTYTGTISYSWSGPNGFVNTTSATPSITNITTSASGSYNLTVTINSCTSDAGTIPVLVNQTPFAPATTPVIYCQNATATKLSATGSNLIWYNNAGLVNGSTIAPTPVTTTVGSTTYYLIDSSNAGCKSGSSSLAVTVNETPVISNPVPVSPQQCQATNGSISFNVTPATGNYNVSYHKNGVAQPTFAANISNGVIVINGLNADSYDNIKVTLNNCPSNTLGPVVLSDPTKPATPVIVGVDSICSGKTLTLNPASIIANGIYTWTDPLNVSTTSNSLAINNIATKYGGVYKLYVVVNLCKSNDTTFSVRVDSTPVTPTLSSNTPVCTDSTIKLFATTVYPMAVTYNWAGVNGFTSTNQNPTISTTTLAMNGAYNAYVTSVVGKCQSQTAVTNVTINETPHIGFKDSTYPNQCATPTGNIRLDGLKANTVYSITYTVDGNNFNQTQTSDATGILKIDTLWAGTYSNIYVTLNACPSNQIGSYTLFDPNPPATPVITAVDTVCSGKSYMLNVASPIANGIYTWTHPNGSTATGTSYTLSNIHLNDNGIYKLYVTLNLCKSKDTTFNVRVDSTPVAPTLSSNTPVCTDSTMKLFATTVYPMAVIYDWAGVNGFASTNQNPTIATATLAMNGAYNAYVTSVVGKCQSQTATTNVTINETPHIGFKDSTYPNQCATPTGNIRLDGLKANTTYSITYTVGGNNFNQTQTSDATGILKIDTLRAGTYSNIFVTLNACPSNQIGSYTLFDPNPPATPVIAGVDSICSGKNIVLNAASPIANATFTWTHPNGSTYTGNSYAINNTGKPDSGSYKLYVTLNLCKSKDTTFNVRVDSTPIAPTLSSNTPVCTDSTINLLATTIYPMAVTYSWTGVNGFTSTLQNPTITNATLTMNGSYTAYVTSVVGKCESQTATTNITVNETPNVVQLNDTTYKDGTNSGNIVFTGTVANTTFNWTNSNPAIGLSSSGSGTINFNATNTTPFQIFGLITVTPSTPFCTGKPMIFKITVNPTPTLSSKLKDTICTDNLYTYQAASTTPNVTYTWSRNVVAGISNAASASTDSSGMISETLTNTTTQPIDVTYNFKLYSLGTVNTVPFVLTVTPDAKALYTFTTDKLCTPAYIDTSNIKVTDFPDANGNYEWYVNGGLIGTGINFPGYAITNNGDTVYIKLQAISKFGCKPDTFVHKFYTVKTPIVSFTKSKVKDCGPLSVDFTNTSTPLNAPTYFWNFGNGQTSTQQSPTNIVFMSDTSYNRHDTTYYITLTAITQCDTIKFVDSVTVLPKPRALFQPNATVGCSVFKFEAFNNSLGTHNTYTWDFDDSSALVIDTASGFYYHNFRVSQTDTFYVKLKAENICGADSFIVNIVVYPNTIVPKLILDGTSNFACSPSNIRFINNTRGANKFTVNFGDGSLPYISNNNPDTIYHYFTNIGNDTVTLKAENHCTDSTVSLIITLYPKPVAGFGAMPIHYCKNQSVNFITTADTTLNFYWDFGDGTNSTAIHPSHIYADTGTYTIKQIVKSNFTSGAICTDTAKFTVVIHELPNAAFTSNANLLNCQPFSFLGTVVGGSNNTYNWKYYDPNSIDTVKAGPFATHIFNDVGVFKVRLVAFTFYGCSDTSYASVKVIETPKALFSLSDSVVCVPGKNITATNHTTYSAADAINFEWYVNGVLKAQTTNFTYNYTLAPSATVAATYIVKLVAINSFGCRDSILKTVIVQPKAIATFQINAQQGCTPFNLQFNNSSQYANIFKWYLDGVPFSTSIKPTPIQLSIPNKTYLIKLVVDHTLGCGADSTFNIFITYPKPVANFQIPVASSCTGVLNINCFDNSSVVGGIIKKWNWNFGDGTTDTTSHPTHTYNTAGAYTVSLWVRDDKFCISDLTTQVVKNFGKPKANFSVGNVCLGSDVVPVNLSVPGFGSTAINSFLWNFGDGTYLTGSQPVHKYNAQGNYNITLTVTSDSSCAADTITKAVKIYGRPTADFSFENSCIKQNAKFTNNSLFGFGQSSIGNSLWTFGDGLTSNVTNPQHIYTAANSYKVTLYVSGNFCPNLIDSASKTIIISQPRNGIAYPRIEGVRGTPIPLNAAGGGVSYLWVPATSLDNAAIQNPVATLPISSPSIVNYQIKITDSFGCVTTDRQEIWLFVGSDIYLPTAFTPNGDNANDVFKPLYVNIQKIQYFRVFDRWGKIVFETSDMGKSWDGTINGKPLPMDSYVWTISGITTDGTEITRKGSVTLIRD